MNLANLSVGQRIPNYKKLCDLLGVPVKKGNSKNAQLKEFDRYFRYTRIGNAYLIDEIYTTPLPQHDDRQKYLYLIEPILLNFFAVRTLRSDEATWNKWFCRLGFVNQRFYDEPACDDQLDFWHANSNSLFRTKNIAKNKMREILTSALKNMKKRNLINYDEHWKVIDRNGHQRTARERDVQLIEEIQQSVLTEMGCDTIQQVYLSPSKYRTFSEKTHARISEQAHWRQVFKVLEIEVLGSSAEQYFSIEPAPLMKELNRKICAAVRTAAYREEEKQNEKLLAAWDEESETPGEKPRPFKLPDRFTWDVEVFVDQLMVL